MGIRMKTDIRELERRVQDYAKSVIRVMVEVGEQAVTDIRDTKTYKDDTGRLTASIGYGVFDDGTLLVSGGFGGGEGGVIGMESLQSRGASTEGLSLVIVAGMDYALYVERKGFVVLDGGTASVLKNIEEKVSKIRI